MHFRFSLQMSQSGHSLRSKLMLIALVVVVDALLAGEALANARAARIEALFARWDRPDTPD